MTNSLKEFPIPKPTQQRPSILSGVNQLVRTRLQNAPVYLFILWCLVASFGAYFGMYAFRKPFNTASYQGYFLWGLDYKVILILSQVFGYMLSKFLGIRIISELHPNRRVKMIIFLILFAELALLLFGLVPFPYNFLCLFLDGLPLGMVWGIVFSFLEGRRFTEILGFGLNISVIVASGVLKTVYLVVQQFFHASEFWMPFIMGALFFPLFCFFVWMLSVIPPPTERDRALRTKRIPMTKANRKAVIKEYGMALTGIIIIYALLTMLRDFRDNFSVEIWTQIDPKWSKGVLAETELITGVIVLIVTGVVAFIRNNLVGLRVTQCLMATGILISGTSTLLFQFHQIQPFTWMLLLGMGLFLAYIPVQTVLFERLIGLFKTKANAGFFVYICDSIGYLGSAALLLYKEFFMFHVSWADVLIRMCYLLTIISMLLLPACYYFFNNQYKMHKKTDSITG